MPCSQANLNVLNNMMLSFPQYFIIIGRENPQDFRIYLKKKFKNVYYYPCKKEHKLRIISLMRTQLQFGEEH